MTFPRSLFVRCGLLTIFIATLLAGAAFAAGPSEYLIYNFPWYTSEFLWASIVADSAGNLYGTAAFYSSSTSGECLSVSAARATSYAVGIQPALHFR
jgi:hypothetical protein